MGTEVRRYAGDRRGGAANGVLVAASGVLLALADALLHPLLVLPLIIAQLTDSLVAAGAGAAIAGVAWFLPQPLGAWVVGGRRKLAWAAGAALVRAAAIALLAYVLAQAAGAGDPNLLRSLLICYGAYVLAGGFAHVAFAGVLDRAVPHGGRPALLAVRALLGTAAAAAAGLIIYRVFDDAGSPFPRNAERLATGAAVALVAAAFLVALVREPGRLGVSPAAPIGRTLRQVGDALADPSLRRYLLMRTPLALAAALDPFYILYARREFDVPLRIAGAYLVALVLARLLSTALWRPIAARHGPKAVLQGAALVRILIPLVALLLPYLADTPLYRERVTDPETIQTLFGLVFVGIGVALGAQILANHAYLVAIAPADRRPAYVGVANAILALVAATPLLVGAALDRDAGFRNLFLVAVLVGFVAVVATGALTNPAPKPRVSPEAWRLRRARP